MTDGDRHHTSEKPRIVVAEPYSDDAMARLHAAGHVQDLCGAARERLLAAVADADALLVRSYVTVDTELLEAAPRLRVIGRGGAGIENLDADGARQRGIVVVYTPDAATRAAAQHTVAMMLALVHKLVAADTSVRRDCFSDFRSEVLFAELSQCVLGVIGMGRIGSTVAGICARGFGMRVMYNDIVDVGPFDFPADAVEKRDLVEQSDVVTLHVPLTSQTRGLIDSDALAQFRPGTLLVNSSRGAVVDAGALARSLVDGRLAGAALDVFDPEPPPPDHPILKAPNVLLTPHMAARSQGGLARMNDVVDDVIAVLQGRAPRFPAW